MENPKGVRMNTLRFTSLICAFIHVCIGTFEDYKFKRVKVGAASYGESLSNSHARSAIQCIMWCAEDVKCFSATFSLVDSTCITNQLYAVNPGSMFVCSTDCNTVYAYRIPETSSLLGKACFQTSDCAENGVACSNNVCACATGYEKSSDGNTCTIHTTVPPSCSDCEDD